MEAAVRSSLFMAINNARFIEGFAQRNSDGASLDLEDSVGEPDKERSRVLPATVYRRLAATGARVSIRINHLPWFADLEAAVWPGLSEIAYPKAESAEEVRRVDARLTELERRRGIPPGTIKLNPITETVRGITNAYAISTATTRVQSVTSGGFQFDMTRDLAIEDLRGQRRAIAAYDMGECFLIAHALGLRAGAGLEVGETVAGNVVSGDSAVYEAAANRQAGIFGGITCLHPNRVEGLNRGFTPPPEELEQAQQIVAYFEELDGRGEVEGEIDGKIVDSWEAERARKLIAWGEACARRDRQKVAARSLLNTGTSLG